MRNYFKRIFTGAKKWEIAFWWIFRAMMIFGAFLPLFQDKMPSWLQVSREIPFGQNLLQMGANTAAMFLWEIFMLFPEKSFLRQIPAYVQNVSAPFIFATAFCGAYLNMYYTLWWWDSMLHTLGAVIGVYAGYEFMCAIQKRDKCKVNLPIILIASLGFCFMFGVLWELFEFSYDQIAHGDSQHWNYAIQDWEGGYHVLIDPGYPAGSEEYRMRFALMDTMADTINNTIGAVIGYILLRIYPYHHKGKHDLNKLYE